MPVKDDAGALATVNLGGERTIRVTILPDSNQDLNYFTFTPAELSGTAQLFEAMSRDLGPVPAGFDDNFAYTTVTLTGTAGCSSSMNSLRIWTGKRSS